MQSGLGMDDIRIPLVGAIRVLKGTGADLSPDVDHHLGGVREAEPGVSIFGGVEFLVGQPLHGVDQAAVHYQAMQPKHRREGGVAIERERSALIDSGPVPDHLGKVGNFRLFTHPPIIAMVRPLTTARFVTVKIYTRKGDSGQTSIWGGRRLSKDHARMEAIGAVDETNAAIGSAAALGLPAKVETVLHTAQGCLFIVGSELMAPDRTGSGSALPRLDDTDVTDLEAAIDALELELPELRNFILPGGSTAAAALHFARGVCRRAERRVATLSRVEDVVPVVPAYLNRLADLLFVAARYTNNSAGFTDVIWSARRVSNRSTCDQP